MTKEQEIKQEMLETLTSYKTIEQVLMTKYKELQANQGLLPQKFTEKKEEYEDHVLFAAQLKHNAIELWRDSLAAFESASADVDYFSAQLKLYLAESFLQEHGFDRATEGLRDSFVKSDKTLKDLIKERGKLESLSGAAERLVRAFESDEINCRRLLERQNKLLGF